MNNEEMNFVNIENGYEKEHIMDTQRNKKWIKMISAQLESELNSNHTNRKIPKNPKLRQSAQIPVKYF